MPIVEQRPPRTGPGTPTGAPSTRILQRMGPVSLGVSLPRPWVETHRLSVGSPVQLRWLPDGTLRLRDERAPPLPRTAHFEVNRGASIEHLFRELLGAYLAGASEFVVGEPTGLSAETRTVVRTFVRRTKQPEVLSEEPNLVRLRDVSEESSVPLARLVGRMGQMVLAFHRDAAGTWGKVLPAYHAEPWEERDDEIDRQAWFVQRLAVRRLDAEPTDPPEHLGGMGPLGWWIVARSLERIADHAVILGETGSRLAELSPNARQVTPIRQFHGQALEELRQVLEALPDGSGAQANDLLDLGEALHEIGRTLTERLISGALEAPTTPALSIALGRLIQSIDRTVAYTQDIAQVLLDRVPATPTALAALVPTPPAVPSLPPRFKEERNTNERE